MNESLDTYIRKDYCKDCLNLTRDLEKTTRKVGNYYRNRLRFSLRCLHLDYTQRSLKLTSNVKGSRAERIIHNTERKLLNERIRQINSTIKNLNSKRFDILGKILDQLSRETYKRVYEFTEHTQLGQHHISKTRQISKLDRPESKSRADKNTNLCNKDGLRVRTASKKTCEIAYV